MLLRRPDTDPTRTSLNTNPLGADNSPYFLKRSDIESEFAPSLLLSTLACTPLLEPLTGTKHANTNMKPRVFKPRSFLKDFSLHPGMSPEAIVHEPYISSLVMTSILPCSTKLFMILIISDLQHLTQAPHDSALLRHLTPINQDHYTE